MFKNTIILLLTCETPTHAGSGDDLGIVDLPIQREKHTQYPKFEASSLKGALRQAFESALESERRKNYKNDDINRLFGPEDTDASTTHAGCLALSDARTLLFPVKSMRGVYVWITCPNVIGRFAKDLLIANNSQLKDSLAKWHSKEIENGKCYANEAKVGINKNVVLEEYAFQILGNIDDLGTKLAEVIFGGNGELEYWKTTLTHNLVVLSNDDFCDFVKQSTEVVTRTKINNVTGTVEDGALFTEEYLPTDTILYSIVSASDAFISDSENRAGNKSFTSDVAMQNFSDTLSSKLKSIFQLGGNSTLGKGIIRTKLF